MSNRFEEIEEEEEEIPSIDPKYANLGNTYCMTLKYLHYAFWLYRYTNASYTGVKSIFWEYIS